MKITRNIILIIVSIMIIACTTIPAQTGQTPEWIIKTPQADSTWTYFVGSGSSEKGDSSEALNDATAKLISDIMIYLGVRVTAETSAIAKATLDSYQTDIVSTVKTESANRLVGFSVKERKEIKDKATGRVMVYILAVYETKELQKEKARIEALFKEKADAVAKPEAAGADAEAANRMFDAIQFYIEAAVAASGSDIENASIKMERNVNNARRVLQKLRFIQVTNPAIPKMNENFSAPFSVKLVYGEQDNSPGVPGVNIIVQYPRKQGTRIGTKTDRAVSGPDGIVRFTPPAPDSIGKMKLTMRINFDSAFELIDGLPQKYDKYREALESELMGRIVTFEYTIGSMASSIPMAINILDLDVDGNVIGSAAQSSLIEQLLKEKYKVIITSLDNNSVIGMNDPKILSEASEILTGKAQRLVYGVVRIQSVSKDNNVYIANIMATIRVIDLETGNPIWYGEKVFSSIGGDEATAKKNALAAIGREVIARELMSNLP